MMDTTWKEISTAPKDRPILVWNGYQLTTAYWDTDCSLKHWELCVEGAYAEYGDVYPYPTHWAELPKPPEGKVWSEKDGEWVVE